MLRGSLSSFFILLILITQAHSTELEDDLSGFTEETSTSQTATASFGEEVSQESVLDGFSDSEDDLGGFLEDESSSEEIGVNTEEKNEFTISGDLSFKTSYGYKDHEVDGSDYSGLNQAQTSIYLQLDTKISDDWKLRVSGDAFYDAIYDLRSNENYRDSVVDDYRTQLRLDDTYIQGRISSSLDVKIGRQIVVWGKSDNIRITDVINPLDNRQPGMTDIEDLRLSVGMAKFDYYLGQWNISAMAIVENRIMTEATPRGEYFPVDSVFNVPGGIVDPFPKLNTPSTSWDNIQYALAANGVFSGWDLSFYAADVLDQRWHFEQIPQPGLSLSERTVSKIKMLGSAVNIVSGSWLYKAEIAFLEGVKYNTTPDDKNRLDTLVGLEYMGIKDTSISVEVANRHIFNHEQRMQYQADFVDKNEMQTALRLTRSFSNDTINFSALASVFGSSWENGGFTRLWGEYELMQAVSVNVGIVEYIGGDKPFTESIKDNDRIFADITYSF